MEKIKSIFLFQGVYNRKEYLLYGYLTPFVVILVGFFIDSLIGVKGTFFAISLLIALYIYIIATIKRARDTKYSTPALVILSFIPYIGIVAQLLLFFAPHGQKGEEGSSLVKILMIGILVVVGLGIVSAIVIPKLASQTTQASKTNVIIEEKN